MKRTQLLFSLLATVLVASNSYGQTKREIMEEDPKLSPNLRIEISPLDFKTTEPYNFAGASLRVAYRANNKFSIVGEFRKEFFDMEDDIEDIPYGYIIGNPKTFAGFGAELTGTFYFASKEKEAEEWLPIKSRHVGYRTIEVTVDPVPTTKLNLYGVRAGLGYDKSTNAIYTAEISEVENPANTITGQNIYPLESRTFFFGGLSYTRIKNIKVEYPTYGIRRKQVLREIYADVLFGGDPKSENMIGYPDPSGPPVTYKVDSYGDVTKIGWRVGVLSTPTGRLINCGYGFEIASMPGVGQIGVNVKLILSLFKKVGLSEE